MTTVVCLSAGETKINATKVSLISEFTESKSFQNVLATKTVQMDVMVAVNTGVVQRIQLANVQKPQLALQKETVWISMRMIKRLTAKNCMNMIA